MFRIIKYYKVILVTVFICCSLRVMAQTGSFKVSGKVSGENGVPVPNVSISIEGLLTDVVLTNDSGEFEIDARNGNVWLLIAPVSNYKSSRIYLNNRKSLNIRLVPLNRESVYDEITTIKGVKAKRDILGSHETVPQDATIEQPTQTITQNLAGRTAGLLVCNHSGMPGDGTFAFIRGIRSLHSNNQPLIIADGVPVEKQGIFRSIIAGHNYDPLISIDPQDITGLTLFKDLEGTSNYGLKSSNGIMLIETLKPTETRTSIDFSLRSGYSMSPDQMPVLNDNQYRTLAQEILISSPYREEEYDHLFPGLFTDPTSKDYYRYIHNTNWQNEVFRNASLFDLGLSIKGGDAISKYGLSVGYQNYGGIIRNTNYDRINLRFVGSFNVFDWMEMYISTSLSNNHSAIRETGISASTSPIMTSLVKTPVMAPYQFDEEGRELSFLDDVDAFGVSNPTAIINESEAHNKNYKFLGTFSLIGNITEELKWNSLLGLNFGNMKENVFMPDAGMESYLNLEGYNEVRQQTAYLKSFYFDNSFGYESDINVMHQYSARIGLRVNTNHSELDFGTGHNTPSDEYKSLRFAQSIHARIGGDIGNWNWMSFYGNAGYSFKNKYMVGLNLSMDGSSRTGRDAETALRLFNFPFGLFYSVNGAWRVSSEQFLNSLAYLDELKLRLSFGLSGNDDIGNYSSRRYYTQLKYRETTGVILGTKPVTDLKFESVNMTNLGLDLSMMGQRLNLAFDYFVSTTKNMLIYERQEDYIGYPYRPTNGGSLQNSGFEAHIFGRIISAGEFKLDAGFNVAHYKNEVLSIKGGSLVTEIEGGEILSSPGHPVNSFYGLIAEGVFTTQDEADEAQLVNDIGLPYMAGDIRFSDLSGPEGNPDGVINEYDKTIIGSPNPDYFGGFDVRATYRRWSLSALIQFVTGHEVFNYMRYQTEKMSNLHNQSTSVLNRWQYDGQDTDIPRSTWDDPMNNNDFSTRWIEDGSYIRGKNITLAYTIPDKFLVFSHARFFASVFNAFTLTRYLGYDPEFSYSSDQLLMGVDYGMVPQCTTFLAGVKLGL